MSDAEKEKRKYVIMVMWHLVHCCKFEGLCITTFSILLNMTILSLSSVLYCTSRDTINIKSASFPSLKPWAYSANTLDEWYFCDISVVLFM